MIQFVQVAFSPCLYPDMLDVDVPNLRPVEYCKAQLKLCSYSPEKTAGMACLQWPHSTREDPSLRSNAGVLGMVLDQIQGDGLIIHYIIFQIFQSRPVGKKVRRFMIMWRSGRGLAQNIFRIKETF